MNMLSKAIHNKYVGSIECTVKCDSKTIVSALSAEWSYHLLFVIVVR